MAQSLLAFAQSFANKLNIGDYSLDKTLTFHYRDTYYTPDIIIYRDGKPFVIVDFKKATYQKESFLKKSFIEINRAQDYFKIEWSLLIVNEKDYYLRHFNERQERFSNIDFVVSTIKNSIVNNNQPSIEEYHIEEIKSILNSTINKLSRKEAVRHFLNNLTTADFTIDNGCIYFIPQKEDAFFKALLVPVNDGNICRYTSSNSLFTLLNSCNQNMLSLNCMNDISEIDYADKYVSTETIVLDDIVKESNNIFILSCCDESMSDDLMMWRLYAQNAEGVNLMYRIYPRHIDFEYFYLAKVSYGESIDSHSELDIIQELLEWNKDGVHFRFKKWMIWKHFFKSYHFKYENEVRLIYHEHNESRATKTIWIKDDNSGIHSPMKLFDLKKSKGSRFPLGLIGIKLGPRHKEAIINRIQIKAMYDNAKIYCPGIKEDINISDIDIYR